MAWIRIVDPDHADGLLARIYRAALARAGKIFNVLRIQSVQPRVLQASLDLYRELMFGPGPLSRAQREMIAVAVSRTNQCVY
jgi:uncharacterized peroxidase-related enzyme